MQQLRLPVNPVRRPFMHQADHNSTEFRMLLDRANAGKAGAFDQLATAATERLRLLAQRMLRKYPHIRRWEETDDVLQTALIRLHQSLEDVQPETPEGFFGLAVTQIRRTLIDLGRHYYGVRGQGANHHSDGIRAADDAGGPLDQTPTVADPPETIIEWTVFHEAIDSLPDDECDVFSLLWYGGLTRRETAEVLAISERTVIRRLNQARLELYDRLEGRQPGAESRSRI